MKRKTTFFILCAILLGSGQLQDAHFAFASTSTDYQAIPPFMSAGAPPLVLMVMGRDHKLYYEAYNDAADLDEDGTIDIRYKGESELTNDVNGDGVYDVADGDTYTDYDGDGKFSAGIDYYGYFDSYKCYSYNSTAPARFEPQRITTNKKCTVDTTEWSGDFLNYLTMSRMDSLRKVLYGGYRSTDTDSTTTLQRVYIPQDAHTWGKEYDSESHDGYLISEYSSLSEPSIGTRHLFASTTLSDNGTPILRVLPNNTHRIWEWVAKERPVADSSLVSAGGNYSTHPTSHTEYDAMVATFATAAHFQGTVVSSCIDADRKIDGSGNPYGPDDKYLTIFAGTLNVATHQDYKFAVDGDDGVEVVIDGTTVASWYGGHGKCNCTSHDGTINLTAGDHTIVFRHQEGGGDDNYYLHWNQGAAINNWQIVPSTRFIALSQSTYGPTDGSTPSTQGGFNTLFTTYAIPGNLYGTSTPGCIDLNINGSGNPVGADDYYLNIFTGDLDITTAGTYQFAVDGDDAVEVIIDGNVIASYYGGHGSCGCTTHSGSIALSSGAHTIEFRHEEVTGGDNYYLHWNGPDSGNTWNIVPGSSFTGLTQTLYDLTIPASTITDYDTRVEVCDSTMPEDNCKLYPNGNFKPTGLLQKYGESNSMYFGLLTGSYAKNTSGGVLRKNISSITDEIISSSGIYDSSVNGIIKTINTLRIKDFDYGSYSYNSNCGWITTRPINEGECRMWGNPVGEMMYEGLRYFAGKGTPTTAFDYSGTTDDSTLGLPKVSWIDPYSEDLDGDGHLDLGNEDINSNGVLDAGEDLDGDSHLDDEVEDLNGDSVLNNAGFSYCSKPFMLVLSDINPSFDSDQLPGSDFNPAFTGDVSGLDVDMLATIISDQEGSAGNHFIGQQSTTFDGACTSKAINDFGEIRGLCPEEPTKQGSYYSASVAYFAHKEDVHPVKNDQNIDTLVVGLASPLPRIEMAVNGTIVTLVPFAKSVGGYGISGAEGDFQPTNTIVDFFVDSITPTAGKFRINYEDVEQGADHDMDAIVEYEYSVAGSNITVSLTSTYASGSIIQHMGYIISGTTKDGIYLEVRDFDTGAGSDPDYFLDTPPGIDPAGAWNDGIDLPLSTSRTFTVGASPGSTLLDSPLEYAAKWGAFEDSNNNNLPDVTTEWDNDGNGIADSYFYVVNPLKLEEQLNRAFLEILSRTSSGTAASVISNTRSGEGAIYQSIFRAQNKETTWTGQVHSLLVDSHGNMREDTPEDANGDGFLDDTEDSNDNGVLDVGEDLNGNGILDLSEDLDGDGILGPGNGKLDITHDRILRFDGATAQLYHDANGNNAIDPDEIINPNDGTNNYTEKDLEEVNFLWNSSTWLNSTSLLPDIQRAYNSTNHYRYIFSFIDIDLDMIADSGEIVDFNYDASDFPTGTYSALTDTSKIYPYLNLYPTYSDETTYYVPFNGTATDITNLRSTGVFNSFLKNQSDRLINYIRGEDYSINYSYTEGPDTYTIPAFRDRTADFDNNAATADQTWRLGDIIHSTPTSVSRPSEGYHLLYRDSSYVDFAALYQNRRSVIYVGSNDGMLHAFNSGFFNSSTKGFDLGKAEPYSDLNGDGNYTSGEPFTDFDGNGSRTSSLTNFDLGSELWAYVPYNLLPHLYWLTEPDYPHVYYIDSKPRVFDAKIFFKADGTPLDEFHPNGWGTVMVVGMRLGGGRIFADMDKTSGNTFSGEDTDRDGKLDLINEDSNNNGTLDSGEDIDSDGHLDINEDSNSNGILDGDRVMSSAFIVMDITNPEQPPTVLAELKFKHLGYSVCYPTVLPMKNMDSSGVIHNNLWYLVIGSGPAETISSPAGVIGTDVVAGTDASLDSATSDQSAKLYLVDLLALATDHTVKTLDTNGNDTISAPFHFSSLDSNAFIPSPVTVDYNLNYSGDAVYFGTVSGNAGSGWGGKLRRIVTYDSTTPTTWEGDSILIDLATVSSGQSISAAPSIALDDEGNNWIYFGTGRFYTREDSDNGDLQSYYGIKEPLSGSTFTWGDVSYTWSTPRDNLLDVSTAEVFSDKTVTNVTGVSTFPELLTAVENEDGWFLDFQTSKERNLGQAVLLGDTLTFTSYMPSSDICSYEGTSNLYALYYKTGTAFYNAIIGREYITNVGTAAVYRNKKKVGLGIGLAVTPNLHVGREAGSKAFVQTSTGAIEIIQQDAPGQTKSGVSSWIEKN